MDETNNRSVPFSTEIVESAKKLRFLIERFNERNPFLRLFLGIDILLAKLKLQKEREVFLKNLRASGCKNPIPYLMEGRELFEVAEFECARVCFDRVLEFLETDDQNVRLPALVGRLECGVALVFQKIERGEIEDTPFYERIKEDSQTIRNDLGFACFDVQIDLTSRLARVDTAIAMFVFRRERIICPLKSHRRNAA